MAEVVWDATRDKNLFLFGLVLLVNLFTAIQTARSWGCDNGELKLRLPSAPGSALRAPAAGQLSLPMWWTEVRRL